MPPDLIRFYGTYRYRSRHELQNAVIAARAQLDEDDFAFDCTIEQATVHGVVLSVDLLVPATADVRFAAANVFETLATGAVEGAVDAVFGERRVDTFTSGDDFD